jgi:CHAT domain-containing protein
MEVRRGFTEVGTKALVMSMWSVQDRETKELVVEF